MLYFSAGRVVDIDDLGMFAERRYSRNRRTGACKEERRCTRTKSFEARAREALTYQKGQANGPPVILSKNCKK